LTGVVLLAVPLVAREIFGGWLTAALILGGVLAIASGAYGHRTACQVLGINTNKKN